MTKKPNRSTGHFLLRLLNKAYSKNEVPIAFFVREDSYEKLLDLIDSTHPLLLSFPKDIPKNEECIVEFNDVPIIPDDDIFREMGEGNDTTLLLKTLPGVTGPSLSDILKSEEGKDFDLDK